MAKLDHEPKVTEKKIIRIIINGASVFIFFSKWIELPEHQPRNNFSPGHRDRQTDSILKHPLITNFLVNALING